MEDPNTCSGVENRWMCLRRLFLQTGVVDVPCAFPQAASPDKTFSPSPALPSGWSGLQTFVIALFFALYSLWLCVSFGRQLVARPFADFVEDFADFLVDNHIVMQF